MVRVIYEGRLGNQLFQYCFGRILATRLKLRLFADPIPGFPGTHDEVDGEIIEDASPVTLSGIVRPDLQALLSAPERRGFIVNAYLQEYKFYAPYLAEIRTWLRMGDYDASQFQAASDSLMVNVRLGDYLEIRWALAPEFFVSLIESIPHRELTIVTDSPRSNYLDQFRKYSPVILHSNPIDDFKWLLNASRLVISQSTFSWWGAILSNAEVWMPETSDSIWSRQSHVDLRVFDNPQWHVVPANTVPPGHGYLSD